MLNDLIMYRYYERFKHDYCSSVANVTRFGQYTEV